MTIIVHNPNTNITTVKDNIPDFDSSAKGETWVYVDTDNTKYYPRLYDAVYNIALVVATIVPSVIPVEERTSDK